ncbi:MAG: MFS transporter [Acidimicrobiaceae bacterium]|nr:MFS transporter [Ilumatobacter sp.]MCB9379785.1 MFS transporter [Acidimicrobiaceae bacterium]MCO5328983.1 MFS transporter [Ilumatobacteraceae bacterium]
MSRSPRRLPGAYWRLYAGSAISNLGDGVLVAALPLLAARITDDRLSVGLVSTFFTIPWLLLALPVGALVDRADRRTVLVLADTYRAVLVGGLAAVAAFADVQMWMLWLLAFGLGAGEVFFDSASTSILPAIVPAEQLERANGWRYSAEVAANTFIGLPIGSALFALAVWLPFGVDAASFVVAVLLTMSLRGRFRAEAAPDGKAGMRRELAEGFGWLRRHRLLRNMAVALGLTNLAFAATESTFVLFATEELGIDEGWFGVLVGIIGAGALVAGILGGRIVEKVGRRFAVVVASFAPIVTMLAIGLLPITWWAVAMTTVQAAMTTVWSIVAVSLRQQLVPANLFGRVNGVYRWFIWGAMPVGGFVGGIVAARFGLRAPYFTAAGVLAVAYLIIIGTVTERAIGQALADAAPPPPVADDTPVFLERDPLDDF